MQQTSIWLFVNINWYYRKVFADLILVYIYIYILKETIWNKYNPKDK